jgi:steroid delta-isomerase
MSSSRSAAEAYIDKVNHRDLEGLVALFAPDAVVLHPVGVFEGTNAVKSFYDDNILAYGPTITACDWVTEGSHCVFELEASVAGHTSHAIDHCTVDDAGKITRMCIAYR